MKHTYPKIILIIFLGLLAAGMAHAQDTLKPDTTQYWKFGGITSLTFSQLSFDNWAAGGDNSLSGLFSLNVNTKYMKNKLNWENTLDMNLGLIKQGTDNAKKSDDRIELATKFGYKASKQWFYSALLSFRTQFLEGFDPAISDSSVLISSFMAPAYIHLSLGMDFQPNDYFSLLISPVSARTTIVMNNELSKRGMFGLEPGDKVLFEIGGYLGLSFKKEVVKNVNLASKLTLFSSYTDHPENVDVDWENNINMSVNKFLSANFILHLLYDNNVIKRLQVKEVFGAGLTYKF